MARAEVAPSTSSSVAGLDVAEGGRRSGRGDADRADQTVVGNGDGLLDRLGERDLVVDHVIGGERADHRIGIGRADDRSGKTDGRHRVAR